MTATRTFVALLLPALFSCAATNISSWQPHRFEGTGFSPATAAGAATIWIRSGYRPTLTNPASASATATRLPSGTGAIAGICYLQTSGGKLRPTTHVTPCPGEQITIRAGNGKTFLTSSDNAGYFLEVLPAGDYELSCRGVPSAVAVKPGETTLVPVRGGKRMAD